MPYQTFVFRLLLSCLFAIVALISGAQTEAYKKRWNEIDSLIFKKNLTRTAMDKVNAIYTQAKKNEQEVVIIKTLLYRMYLQERIEERNINKQIAWLQKESSELKSANARGIISSLIAQQYHGYFNNNRWRFYNRTNTVNFKKEDIETWSADDFHKTITYWYDQSLKAASTLQGADIDNYKSILTYYNTKDLRPTLFDLLAHRALQYFKSDETYINRPAYQFKIEAPESLGSISDFTGHSFTTRDSLSNKWKALLLFQQLIRFHNDKNDTAALIDVNLDRLAFARDNGTMPRKDTLFLQALEEMAQRFDANRYAAAAWYEVASWHSNKASSYSPTGDTASRWEYVKALEILNRFLPLKDSTEGHYNIFNLYQTIHQKSATLTTEQVNVPDVPFRSLLQYRNISAFHYRLIKHSRSVEETLNKAVDKKGWAAKFTAATKLSYLFQQDVSLPETNDYQTHSVEIKVNALSPGKYLLLGSSAGDFNDSSKLVMSTFYVSNVSYVNNGSHYFVLDRTTGHPLKEASVKVWENTYNNKKRIYEDANTDNLTTDANGYFKLPFKPNSGRNIRLQIRHGNDELSMDNQQYVYPLSWSASDDDGFDNEEEYEAQHSQAYFFTDRSIYRPGQTVYFKVLALTKDRATKKLKLITAVKKNSHLYLHDVNGKRVDSAVINLNEYGSFAGNFKLPVNVLTGHFRFSTTAFHQVVHNTFSVEEYKRPTFYVELEKPKGVYRLNDSITIAGTAKAYSGNTVDGAKVKYNVTRRSRMMYPWLMREYIWPPRASEQTTITFGEAVTDATGKFSVTFKASPDEEMAKTWLPVFDFEITADATDRSGETRSSSTSISVGYHSLNLQMAVKEMDEVDSLKSVKLITTNLSGDKQPASVKLNIYKLQPPKQLIRKRYWQQPDQFVFTEEEYKKLFPHDEYKNESDKTKWEKSEAVYSATVDTKETENAPIPSGKLTPGWYVVEASTTDKDGHEIKDKKYVQLYSRGQQGFEGDYLFATNDKSATNPNVPVSFLIGSGAGNVHLIREVQHKPKLNNSEIVSEFSFHKLDKDVKDIAVTPIRQDIGGIAVNFVFVKDNRVFTYNKNILVVEPVDTLHVEVLTYRNKLEPGSKETWTLKVSGKNNEAVAAEVLTSMYDASLDQFKPHSWQMPYDHVQLFYGNGWDNNQGFYTVSSEEIYLATPSKYYPKAYADIDVNLSRSYSDFERLRYKDGTFAQAYRGDVSNEALSDRMAVAGAAPAPMELRGRVAGNQEMLSEAAVAGQGGKRKAAANGLVALQKDEEKENKEDNKEPLFQLRTNFNETAFFLPQLATDKDGSISFTFTLPDALTQWKWQMFAHDKLARFILAQRTIVSQKTLMIQANAPRFMREGDKMEFSAKVSNLSDKDLKGSATLELLDAVTLEPVDAMLSNTSPKQSFTVSAGQSSAVKFSIAIPTTFNKPITWRIVAKAGSFADGEENTLPVLTNRMLVTESLPLYMRNTSLKRFEFTKLKENKSSTLQHQSLTVEYTSNPAWYALQSLPYLIDFPYECSEQTFNRFFANALASKIMNSYPRIRQVFEEWKKDTSALKSNLQKNEELKSLLIQETPWLLQAESEEQQKKNLAILLDAATIEKSSRSIITKLAQMQMPSGGFPWFSGGREDRYITQYIVTGIGRLQHMQAIPASLQGDLKAITVKAMLYLDEAISADYKNLKKYRADLKTNNTGFIQLQYLYMRSFFPDMRAMDDKEAYNFFYGQSKKYWIEQSHYFKAMIGEFLYRNGDRDFVNQNILPALLENAVIDADAGMYWKGNGYSWYWYHAPIEQQALAIEFISEVYAHEKKNYLLEKVNDMKTWLLRQKQTTNWRTTKATADACYALLMNGGNWLSSEREAEVKVGDSVVSNVNAKEEGTGYFKTKIDGVHVTPAMAEVSVSMEKASGTNATSPSWGAVYWQYFENLDKITPASTPLLINKKLFVQTNTDRGAVLQPVNDGDKMKVGDKVKIRVEIKVDRDMEYVHLKDMRAASMEPVNVLSSYKWQDGLGYYESTRDASTNFFISYLPRGVYVFEYPVTITHTGNFSVGIASAQCMYAPEFNSHSEGVRVEVE